MSIIEDSKQLDNLQTEYAKLDFVFKDSSEYPAYQQLQEQIRRLKEDLDRLRNLERQQQSNSIALCNEALQIISDEQARFHDRIRFQPKLSKLAEHLQGKVKAYIQELENQANLLNQSTDGSKKLELANKLLNQIQSQTKQNTEMLTSQQQQFLERLLKQCTQEQNKDRESKIIGLFQELPREQRVSLLQRLPTYLSNTTEELNG